MNRDELFQQAKKIREKGESKAQNNQSRPQFDNDREPLHSTALTIKPAQKGFKQVRMLGNPIEARNDDPFSPRIIETSTILGDDGKKFRCIWGSKEDNPSWVLWKVYNKVMSFTYNRSTQERDYHYKDKFPELFNRVSKNNDMENAIEQGWRPKKSVIMNVIDRDFMDWHQENKSTLLLSRKASPMDDGSYFYDAGFPITVYNAVYDTIVSWAGSWENYDVVIEVVGKDPWYRAYHPIDDARKLEGLQYSPYQEYAERPLSEEEQSWKQYNLDEVFRPTTHIKIDNRLGVFIQEVDKKLNTNFYPEVKEKAEAERKEYERIQQEAEKSVTSVEDKAGLEESSSEENTTEQVKEQPKPRPRPRKPAQEKSDSEFNIEDYAETYPGVSELTNDEKNAIVGYDESAEKFLFKEGSYDELFVCPDENCNMDSPDWFHACPGCGTLFEA